MDDLSSRLVTILITDLEDSTRRWEEDPDLMDASLVRHDAILRTEIERYHGVVTFLFGALEAFDKGGCDKLNFGRRHAVKIWARRHVDDADLDLRR